MLLLLLLQANGWFQVPSASGMQGPRLPLPINEGDSGRIRYLYSRYEAHEVCTCTVASRKTFETMRLSIASVAITATAPTSEYTAFSRWKKDEKQEERQNTSKLKRIAVADFDLDPLFALVGLLCGGSVLHGTPNGATLQGTEYEKKQENAAR
ncbi:hypothetical protein V8C26DRAFT_344391 [Trichoderma gracile]